MQRRNFISNLAVILPAGMVAPKLLFENDPQYNNNLVKTDVLVLGAGSAGLFIAQKLKKAKIETIVLEPSGGVSRSAGYNHPVKAGVLKQSDKHQKASVESISAKHYSDAEDLVTLDFIPTEIKKTADGFIVTNGKKSFIARKLMVAMPVEMNTHTAALTIKIAEGNKSVAVSCKKKNQKNPAEFRTISAEKIDEDSVMKFARKQSQGILAIL